MPKNHKILWMHSYVTSKNVKWCHLIWPTLYTFQALGRASVTHRMRVLGGVSMDVSMDGTQSSTILRYKAINKQTFIRKKVMLVSRSTVDLRSCSRDTSDAGNVFCTKYQSTKNQTQHSYRAVTKNKISK